jgi:hypothetical protein
VSYGAKKIISYHLYQLLVQNNKNLWIKIITAALGGDFLRCKQLIESHSRVFMQDVNL